jgi:hypothetical protein
MLNGKRLMLVLLVVAVAGFVLADERTAVVDSSEFVEYKEELDMPPAIYKPRDDYHARSEAFSAAVGSFTSIQVNVDALGLNIVGDAANEPSIALDPNDPDSIVIGWRQFDSIASNFRQAGYAYTTDGGATWTFPGSLTPGTFRSDPVLDFDLNGNLYYHSLQQSFNVDVFKSQDGGQSWGAPVPAGGGDKNWMVVDRSGGIGDGNVYGVWRPDFGCCGPNMFNRSEDEGASFGPPVPVPRDPGIGTMSVGPDGAVYVGGFDEAGPGINEVVVGRSTNAQNPGSTAGFTTSEVPIPGSISIFEGPNPQGLMGQVNVVADHSGSGFVYVLVSVDPDAPGSHAVDVFFSRSADGGQSWTPGVTITDAPPNTGSYHWMAALGVAPNGRLDAIWNDTRNSGSQNVSELFYSYSYDHGDTWSPNIPVSPSFNTTVGWPQQSKIGDYYTVFSTDTAAHVAYAATFNGEQDVYYIELFPDCNDNGISDVADVAGASSDCNGNLIPDECETGELGCGAGAAPNGASVPGQALRVAKSGNGMVELSWGASCVGSDSDYGIYEGAIGDFFDHSVRLCSTGGATDVAFSPAPASSYYLVVPNNGAREGSYGTNSNAIPRIQSGDSCFEQQVSPCQIAP